MWNRSVTLTLGNCCNKEYKEYLYTYPWLLTYCYGPSVRLSACLSVTFRYRGHKHWNTSKITLWLIGLGFLLTSKLKPQHDRSTPKGTPWNYGWVLGIRVDNSRHCVVAYLYTVCQKKTVPTFLLVHVCRLWTNFNLKKSGRIAPG